MAYSRATSAVIAGHSSAVLLPIETRCWEGIDNILLRYEVVRKSDESPALLESD